MDGQRHYRLQGGGTVCLGATSFDISIPNPHYGQTSFEYGRFVEDTRRGSDACIDLDSLTMVRTEDKRRNDEYLLHYRDGRSLSFASKAERDDFAREVEKRREWIQATFASQHDLERTKEPDYFIGPTLEHLGLVHVYRIPRNPPFGTQVGKQIDIQDKFKKQGLTGIFALVGSDLYAAPNGMGIPQSDTEWRAFALGQHNGIEPHFHRVIDGLMRLEADIAEGRVRAPRLVENFPQSAKKVNDIKADHSGSVFLQWCRSLLPRR